MAFDTRNLFMHGLIMSAKEGTFANRSEPDFPRVTESDDLSLNPPQTAGH